MFCPLIRILYIMALYLFLSEKSTISIHGNTKIVPSAQILYVERSVKIVDFGLRLKTLRKRAGLTQQQLAAQLGITKSVVSFYELQARSPSPEVLVKLAQIFHVSTDYLLGLDVREMIDVSGLNEEDISALRRLAESLKRKK